MRSRQPELYHPCFHLNIRGPPQRPRHHREGKAGVGCQLLVARKALLPCADAGVPQERRDGQQGDSCCKESWHSKVRKRCEKGGCLKEESQPGTVQYWILCPRPASVSERRPYYVQERTQMPGKQLLRVSLHGPARGRGRLQQRQRGLSARPTQARTATPGGILRMVAWVVRPDRTCVSRRP